MRPIKSGPLIDQEIEELDAFLLSDDGLENAMDVSGLDGFLCAVLSGPNVIMPSEWMRWVWDSTEGKQSPEFTSEKQAQRILDLLMRHANDIAVTTQTLECGRRNQRRIARAHAGSDRLPVPPQEVYHRLFAGRETRDAVRRARLKLSSHPRLVDAVGNTIRRIGDRPRVTLIDFVKERAKRRAHPHGRSSGRSDASSALSDLSRMISLSLCTTILATSSARSPRSPWRVAVADLPWLATRCFFNDFAMTSSMSVAGTRETSTCLVWRRGASSGVLAPLLRCRRREPGRPTRLTRSLPLHAGKASTRSSDSGRQLSWRGLGPYDGRHRRSNPASRWSDLLRTTVRWGHWARDFCRTASNSARSMIEGCSPGRISFLYLTSPI